MSSWRPDNWDNPHYYQVEEESGDFGWMVADKARAFEEGADAMLEKIIEFLQKEARAFEGSYYGDSCLKIVEHLKGK